MVKRRALIAHALVRQRFQEGHNRSLVISAEAGPLETGIDTARGKITAPAVEVHQLIERGLAAIQEVRSSKLDVAQVGRFDCAAD